MTKRNYLATIQISTDADGEGAGVGKIYAEPTEGGYTLRVELPSGEVEDPGLPTEQTEGDLIPSIDGAWGPDGGDVWGLEWTEYALEMMP